MRGAVGLAMLGFVTLASQGWAASATMPKRVDGIPNETYEVIVSDNPTGEEKYAAVLFKHPNASVELNPLSVPRQRAEGQAAPDKYLAEFKARPTIYEIPTPRGTSYLAVPDAAADIVVWGDPTKGPLSVSIRSVSREAGGGAGGGGGGGGGGAGSGM